MQLSNTSKHSSFTYLIQLAKRENFHKGDVANVVLTEIQNGNSQLLEKMFYNYAKEWRFQPTTKLSSNITPPATANIPKIITKTPASSNIPLTAQNYIGLSQQ